MFVHVCVLVLPLCMPFMLSVCGVQSVPVVVGVGVSVTVLSSSSSSSSLLLADSQPQLPSPTAAAITADCCPQTHAAAAETTVRPTRPPPPAPPSTKPRRSVTRQRSKSTKLPHHHHHKTPSPRLSQLPDKHALPSSPRSAPTAFNTVDLCVLPEKPRHRRWFGSAHSKTANTTEANITLEELFTLSPVAARCEYML